MIRLKKKDFSTVIIVNKDQNTKSIRIPTWHLNNLRRYIAAIVCVMVALLAAIIFLTRQNTLQQAESEQLLSRLNKLKGLAPTTKLPSAQSYIQSIQIKIKTIDSYLRRRGVKGFSTKSTGGGDSKADAKLTDKEVYSMYDDYLTKLVTAMAFTPMGLPRSSNITSGFGYRDDPFNNDRAELHPGIDFSVHKGDAVKCTANGKIVFAGWRGGYGNCIRIQHMGNYETLYGHLSKIKVKLGQDVNAGEVIGLIGSTGHSTGPHLHYEVLKNGRAVPPASFLTLNN